MTITATIESRLVRSRDEMSLRADRGSMTSRDDINVTNLRFVSKPCAPHCANTAGTVSPVVTNGQMQRKMAKLGYTRTRLPMMVKYAISAPKLIAIRRDVAK